MYGMQSVTYSPSSFSMRRSTPWVEGCCGPMLTYISSMVSPVRSITAVVPMGMGLSIFRHLIPLGPAGPPAVDFRFWIVDCRLAGSIENRQSPLGNPRYDIAG